MIDNFQNRSKRPTLANPFGVHYFYTEGQLTEPTYIQSLRDHFAPYYRAAQNRIDFVFPSQSSGTTTVKLARFAVKDLSKRIKAGETIDYAWVIFDKDDHPLAEVKEAISIVEKANLPDVKVSALNSNECFEVWLCLHFDYLEAALGRESLFRRLRDKLHLQNSYTKHKAVTLKEMEQADGNLDRAIKFAERLDRLHGVENPSSGMYKLAKMMRQYFE